MDASIARGARTSSHRRNMEKVKAGFNSPRLCCSNSRTSRPGIFLLIVRLLIVQLHKLGLNGDVNIVSDGGPPG